MLQLYPATDNFMIAPVAQGIERRPPEPGAQVRFLPGAPMQTLSLPTISWEGFFGKNSPGTADESRLSDNSDGTLFTRT